MNPISGIFLCIIMKVQKTYKMACSNLVNMLQYLSVADMCMPHKNNEIQVCLWEKQGGTYGRDYGLFCS